MATPTSSRAGPSQWIQWEDEDDEEDVCEDLLPGTPMRTPALRDSARFRKSPTLGKSGRAKRKTSPARQASPASPILKSAGAGTSKPKRPKLVKSGGTKPARVVVSSATQMIQDDDDAEYSEALWPPRPSTSATSLGSGSGAGSTPTIASCSSLESPPRSSPKTNADKTDPVWSSGKKRPRKFGLSAKLNRVLQQHASDLALNAHAHAIARPQSMSHCEDLQLAVLAVHEGDPFWRVVRCQNLAETSHVYDVVLNRANSDSCHSDKWGPGDEILVRPPYFVSPETPEDKPRRLYGARDVELVDQRISNKKRPCKEENSDKFKTVFEIECPLSINND